ncbi:hypothetical protein HDU98_009962 [Podochytrium sp. JEL0797]|nr:hypothetical protein HDU98_009962 [Podochytrium sp. JEL0797]
MLSAQGGFDVFFDQNEDHDDYESLRTKDEHTKDHSLEKKLRAATLDASRLALLVDDLDAALVASHDECNTLRDEVRRLKREARAARVEAKMKSECCCASASRGVQNDFFKTKHDDSSSKEDLAAAKTAIRDLQTLLDANNESLAEAEDENASLRKENCALNLLLNDLRDTLESEKINHSFAMTQLSFRNESESPFAHANSFVDLNDEDASFLAEYFSFESPLSNHQDCMPSCVGDPSLSNETTHAFLPDSTCSSAISKEANAFNSEEACHALHSNSSTFHFAYSATTHSSEPNETNPSIVNETCHHHHHSNPSSHLERDFKPSMDSSAASTETNSSVIEETCHTAHHSNPASSNPKRNFNSSTTPTPTTPTNNTSAVQRPSTSLGLGLLLSDPIGYTLGFPARRSGSRGAAEIGENDVDGLDLVDRRRSFSWDVGVEGRKRIQGRGDGEGLDGLFRGGNQNQQNHRMGPGELLYKIVRLLCIRLMAKTTHTTPPLHA